MGAGVLGFFINPPLALYYMQGLLTTAAHGHAALFGVYGLLGIGLLLFCMRGLNLKNIAWSDRLLTYIFWLLNGGLVLMVFFSLLPQGLMQAYTSFAESYWTARSAEFIHSYWMEFAVWVRVPGDIVFSLGAIGLFWFILSLYLARRAERQAISSGN